MKLPNAAALQGVGDLIARALAEDIGDGDATTKALVPRTARAKAAIVARDDYTVSGTEVAAEVFRAVSRRLKVRIALRDGKRVRGGQSVMTIEGPAQAILTAERTALNLLQRMTGVASLTSRFVERAAPHGVAILDTRKTIPGMRSLDKYAVLCGGGRNHRMGLYDMVLVKDNHRLFWQSRGEWRLDAAVRKARRRFPALPVEVEVESEAELVSALLASPEWILLDNMTPRKLRRCVKVCAGRVKTEASGGITLDTVAAVAASGVDAISIGALTHSAPAADLSLEITGVHPS